MTLRLLDAADDALPWQRQPNESEQNFLSFLGFLHAAPRPIPSGTWQRTALEHDWAGRAKAFDDRVNDSLEGSDPMYKAARALARFVIRECQRYDLDKSIRSPDRGILAAFTWLMGDPKAAAILLSEKPLDLSNLTQEELDVVDNAQKVFATKLKTGRR